MNIAARATESLHSCGVSAAIISCLGTKILSGSLVELYGNGHSSALVVLEPEYCLNRWWNYTGMVTVMRQLSWNQNIV